MNTNSNTNTSKLNQFTNPDILHTIGFTRLAKLLGVFSSDLARANIVVPAEPDYNNPPINGEYYDAVAAVLASSSLPEPLISSLVTIQRAAAPENTVALDEIIQRRIPCVGVNRACPLDCALELFFACPDELSAFVQSSSSSLSSSSSSSIPCLSVPRSGEAGLATLQPCERGPAAPESVPIENPKSKFENPDPAPNSQPSTDVSSPALDARPSALDSAPPSPIQIRNSKFENSSPISLPPGWVMQVEPWPEPVNGALLLDSLRQLFNQCVVLPPSVAELLPLFVLHTYAYQLRDISVYLGIESPIKRCGKTTLLSLLLRLVNRPVVSANVSSSSFYHVIQELKPTLMIDEADRFLKSRQELQGIMNAGYTPDTAYVVRMGPPAPGSKASSSVNFFFVWCPKVIAQIGHLPETLADRCIVFRMQRKVPSEECKRIRQLDTTALRRQCARFVLDHAKEISAAKPNIPKCLNDRAADIWEPLFALADIAGGDWPSLARNDAVALASGADENSLIGSLLLDIFIIFCQAKAGRIFGRDLVDQLNTCGERPWLEPLDGKPITDRWLCRQLRPYGIHTRTIWINDVSARGYLKEDFTEAFLRYISKSDFDKLRADLGHPPSPDSENDAEDENDKGEGLAA